MAKSDINVNVNVTGGMLERGVEAVRSLVRPTTLLSIIGGIIGFLAVGKVEEAEMLGLLGAPILGWWFAERQQTRNGDSE